MTFRYRKRLDFIITVDEGFSGNFSSKGSIGSGDTIFNKANKYADKNLKDFMGETYTEYTIVNSKIESSTEFEKVYLTDAITTRRLMFDKMGLVITQGHSTQRITIDLEGHIKSLVVVKSEIAITGGTGDFMGSYGTYDVKTLENGLYHGTLVLYIPSSIVLVLVILLIILLVKVINKKLL